MWKGAVSFGLVSIPVNLYTATESKNVTFHQVHEKDGGRVRTRRVCAVDGEEVAYHDIAKGYETADGSVVVLTDDDFAGLSVPSARAVDVLEFVPLESIDPIYFDKTYYLEPQQSGIKPYLLLRDALHKSGHVAIAKIALRQRESLAVVRVHADCLVLSTMLWPDEVRKPDFAFLREDAPPVRDAELAMAGSLIDSMSEEVFEPEQYTDTYRDEVQALIDAKVQGKAVAQPKERDDSGGQVVDLMAALTASIEASGKRRSSEVAASEDAPEEPKEAPARKSPAKKAPAKKAPAKKAPAKKSVSKQAAAKRSSR
ncbi:MAG: Ku protein [Mycobacteriaceae bacterium]